MTLSDKPYFFNCFVADSLGHLVDTKSTFRESSSSELLEEAYFRTIGSQNEIFRDFASIKIHIAPFFGRVSVSRPFIPVLPFRKILCVGFPQEDDTSFQLPLSRHVWGLRCQAWLAT